MDLDQKVEEICRVFRITYPYLGCEAIQMGNVNQTYKVNFQLEDGSVKSFLLQNVNTYAFRKSVELMENIERVTEHIRRKCPEQVCLHFHHTEDGRTYYRDGSNFWRMSNYIPSVTYNATKDLSIVRNAGRAFGEFQQQLSDFDISSLHETISDFHNTRKRFADLDEAIREDKVGRAAQMGEEIAYIQSVRDLACTLTDLQTEGKLPLRVTHNDTKINNVLFSRDDGRALVVVDLDTVMPGVIGNDFGDAIRFAANAVEEDCPDYDSVHVDLDIFRAFTEGFLEMTASSMTETELDTLALSCFCLTAELVARFLEDYLRGDPYFKIRYPEHSRVRTQCQIALCKDMLKKRTQMEEIIRQCAEKYR